MNLYGKRSATPGSAPGLLVPRSVAGGKVLLRLMHYSGDSLEERSVDSVGEALDFVDRDGVTWIDIVGSPDVATLERLGERLRIHSLALEDVMNSGQRPKVEHHEGHIFVVLKQIHLDGANLEAEQVSMFFGDGFLVTVQETEVDDWESVRARIRGGRVRIRSSGSDYLAYALVDAIIDSFFPVLEEYGDRIEVLQEELLLGADDDVLQRIHGINRDLIMLRRSAWPHREVANSLERSEPPLVQQETRIFLRDCYDHTVQTLDILESYRDLARGLMDLYLSMVSNRMNEVMKVLTIMASIFIPMTFLAGIYGMNFNTEASPLNMPELDWHYAYPTFWAVMILMGGGMAFYFKRKNWW